MDPQLQRPLARNLAYTGGLSFLAAVPLFFLINIPLFGGASNIMLAAGLALGYALLIFAVWHFAVGRRGSAGAD